MLKRFMKDAVKAIGSSLAGAVVLPLLLTASARAAVPGVIASSTVQLATGLGAPTKVVVDSLGNVYTADAGGNVWEIPVAGGAAVKVITGLASNTGLAIDAAGDVIATDTYNGHVYLYPNVNGTLNVGGKINIANNLGGLDGYYASFADAAVTSGNVVYLSVSYCNGSCGTAGKDAIFSVKTDGSSPAVVLASLPGGLAAYSLAVDNANHLYYADGVSVYSVDLTAKTATPVVIGTGLSKPAGVQVDAAGNLYISDTGNQRVVVIPNESGALNPADQYTLAAVANLPYGVGIDGAGNLYSGDKYASGSVNKTTIGGAGFGTSPVGTASKNVNVSFAFNASYTPVQIALSQGLSNSAEFTNIFGGNCRTGTTYTAGQSCTVQLGFTPGSTGSRSGAVSLLDVNSKAQGTAFLFGIGGGAALTIDPGAQTALTGATGASYNTPMAVAFDAAGNIYTADGGNSLVFVTPVGTTTASKTIGSGLKNPSGVSVDGAGNVYVADTGNNRIIKIPNEGGTLVTADQVVIATGLNGPTGIRVSADGTLYVADTGSGRVLRFVTSLGAGNFVQSTLGAACTATLTSNCFTTPAGVTTDALGNIYVSDSTKLSVVSIGLLSGAQAIVAGQLGTPTSLGVDAANNLYVVEFGSKDVIRIPNVGGALVPTSKLTIGLGLSIPAGVAVNGAGNVLIADSGKPAVYSLVRTGGLLDLGRVNLTLSGAQQQVTVTSAGTLTATLGTPPYAATGATTSFTISNPSSNPCTAGLSLAQGTTCGLNAVFAPVATGQLTETLTFSTNALNAPALTASITGFGTNLSLTQTALSLVSPTSGTLSLGQTIIVSAAVTTARAGVVPSGPVTFFVDGVAQTPALLSTTAPYTASLTFSLANNNKLTAGTHIINASYGGDTLNASSNAIAPLTLVVTRASDTLAYTRVLIVPIPPVPPAVIAPPPLILPIPNSPITEGGALNYQITLTPGVAITPTGTVTLYVVGTTLPVGTGTLAASNVAGSTLASTIISITTGPYAGSGAVLPLGQYQLYAVYSGDPNYFPASTQLTPSAVNVTVPDYIVSTTNSALTVKAGQSVTTTITIQTVGGFGGSTFIPSSVNANGTTVAAQISSAIVEYACSTLPANAKCTFSPGYEMINSYNSNDALYQTSSGVSYGSDPNFQNTYTVSFTVQTDAVPPLASGIFWPGCFFGLGLLTLASRKRFREQSGRLALLSILFLFGAMIGATGCSTKNNFGTVTPTGTSAFAVNFNGGEVSAPAVPVQTITAFSVVNNVITFTGANTFQPGRKVLIAGLKVGTQFNGQYFTVLAAGLSGTSWSATFTGANIAQTTDAGTATGVAIAHTLPFQLTVTN